MQGIRHAHLPCDTLNIVCVLTGALTDLPSTCWNVSMGHGIIIMRMF